MHIISCVNMWHFNILTMFRFIFNADFTNNEYTVDALKLPTYHFDAL